MNYKNGKERAREVAQEFLNSFTDGQAWSYEGLCEVQAYLERLARRYGLLQEFKGEGII